MKKHIFNFKKYILSSKLGFWWGYFVARVLNFICVLFRYRQAKVAKFDTMQEIHNQLSKIKWQPDEYIIFGHKFKHGWMRSAEYVQWCVNKDIAPKSDCDEFATYAAKALQSILSVQSSGILTVRWITPENKIEGHNVGFYIIKNSNGVETFGHMGNWGHFKGYLSMKQMAIHISQLSRGRLFSYGVADANMRFLFCYKA